MLTARGEELDKVLGLELGADDYITKPFSIREFRSRVRAILRRAATPAAAREREEVIERGDVRIDLPRRTVEVRGEPVQLTFIEFEMLALLASSPGVVFSRRELLERLRGGADYREPRTIDVHVRHLREKIEADPSDPELILTNRGAGYRFRLRVRLPGGIRARIALVLVGIVAGALGTAYLIVIPSLERRLVDARLEELVKVAVPLSEDLPENRFLWPETVERFDVTANARVVAFDVLSRTPPGLSVHADSRQGRPDVTDDDVALRALASGDVEQGRVVVDALDYADVAVPVGDDAVLLFQAPLADSLATVELVRSDGCSSRRASRWRSHSCSA